jgi:hypothetical protein
VAVSQISIFRFVRHLGFTFKKILHAAEQDRPDVAAAWKAWFKMQTRLHQRKHKSSMKPLHQVCIRQDRITLEIRMDDMAENTRH